METCRLSTFLFARPSAAEGAGRVLDFGGTMSGYNQSLTGQQADAIALAADWRAVGEDLVRAMADFASEHPEALADGIQKEPAGAGR